MMNGYRTCEIDGKNVYVPNGVALRSSAIGVTLEDNAVYGFVAGVHARGDEQYLEAAKSLENPEVEVVVPARSSRGDSVESLVSMGLKQMGEMK